MLYDIVIAGAGPAGLTAALYARRAGHSVLVLEGGVPGGQAVTTPHVENWPGTLSISGPDFAMGLYQQCTELGAEIQFAAVTGFEDRGDRKTVRAGEQIFEGRTFILANGVRRRKLEVPGEERLGGRGVSYCATCDGSFFKGKDVAVVGGGNPPWRTPSICPPSAPPFGSSTAGTASPPSSICWTTWPPSRTSSPSWDTGCWRFRATSRWRVCA